MPPRVSILLPCYNAAATLEEALDSLAAQTFSDYELICVDDGSTDATPEILARRQSRDARLRLLLQPHQGIVTALQRGLADCRAPLVARMDADDYAHPERLAEQAAHLDRHPGTALVSCLVAGFPEGQVRTGFQLYLDWLNSLVSDAEIRREIFVESPLPHPSVMFRKAAVEQVGGYLERGWPEDYDLWLRLYRAGARFAKVPRELLAWREHPERLTRTDSRYSLENFLRAKAYHLAHGPLANRDGVLIWGAGMVGRRISKHLLRHELPLLAFIDIDPRKIGRSRRGRPIISPTELPGWWERRRNPALLAAVGARGARVLIRQRLTDIGLVEGKDWWGVA